MEASEQRDAHEQALAADTVVGVGGRLQAAGGTVVRPPAGAAGSAARFNVKPSPDCTHLQARLRPPVRRSGAWECWSGPVP